MHKSLITTLLSALFVAGAMAQEYFVSTSFHEPATDGLRFIYSADGLRWDTIQGTFLTPEVGKQKVMRDPSIAVGADGTFHLVWTSSWRGDRGFGYSSSKDLIHWSEQRFIEVMPDTNTVNVWAPELFFDNEKKQFLIVWASCIPGKFPDGQEDHKNNHRLYYTTTKDFKKFAPTKLFYDPGFSCIDATIVKRSKGDYVMVVKDNTRPERNIKVAFASSPYGPWSEASEPFTANFTEGPSTAKLGDTWYIYYDSYGSKNYGAHKTKDFKKFWNQAGDVHFPVGHKHGTVFKASKQIIDALKGYNRDVIHYTGKDVATPIRHDGGLRPTVGVHNIQTMRGERPWTYNHQPMMVYWNNKFWISYLTDPRSEHEAPGKTMLLTSNDGYSWSEPSELFPEYNVPDGFTKKTWPGVVAKNLKAIMHQRVGFYVWCSGAKEKLLAIGNYCVALTPKDDPNDGNAIGRVVREVKANGELGPIYFIYYNHDFSEKNTDYPYYKRSKDKDFVKACEALLADPLQRMQWVEEADRNDKIIPLNKPYKAFCYYTLPDGRVVSLWKHALTSLSSDGGNTWRTPVYRAPGFVNSNAKIWGQRLSDGTYATVYNPSEYRWPLAISLSGDGLEYTTLSLINGEVTPLRHGGNYKSYGAQYTRGIQEHNGSSIDKNLWVTYSNNKEDIWISRIAVPVATTASRHANENFSTYKKLSDMTEWNIYSPLWAPVSLDGAWLKLQDKDPYDYAKVERVIPATENLRVEFDVVAEQNNFGVLHIEFADDKGNVCNRIVIDSIGKISVKGGARYGTIAKEFKAGQKYHLAAIINTKLHQSIFYIDGQKACTRMFDTPVENITRIIFRTGDLFLEPNIETPADQDFDMPRADEQDRNAVYRIANLTSRSIDSNGAGCVLNYRDFAHYVNYFNTMEEESMPTDISNAQASEWMAENIPLFDCPQDNFREMYYFRWWSLRKHIIRTPAGYGMTEFIVKRSYADLYNLIACAIGHHVMEMRWARDTTYLNQIVRTWYYGNNGKAMNKMNKFSSWNPAAIYEAWKVNGDTAFLLSLRQRLTEEYDRWQSTNRLESGLYWQGDVQDGMEESISGGRKKKFARPTINSYMYGNAKALEAIALLVGDKQSAEKYAKDAAELKSLITNKLWSSEQNFFETMRGDTLAQVREAIGYIPWYFNLPDDDNTYDAAWQQLTDPKGFSAPYGLTTAERRHPLFRSHGFGKCEWDGAIWPFATSQTLTALANYLNDYSHTALTDSVFFRQMELYVESQHMRGRPYIGEYLDETTGYWLMGDRERSKYYNHSTFADLVITGIVGVRPQADGSVVVNPLIPQDKWNYFCLDGVNYHGHSLTIVWDKDGQRYHRGSGLSIFVDGVKRANRKDLGSVKCEL